MEFSKVYNYFIQDVEKDIAKGVALLNIDI